MSIIVPKNGYDVEKTLRSGQVFRYSQLESGKFLVLSKNKYCTIETRDEELVLTPSIDSEEDNSYWRNYFNLDYFDGELVHLMLQNPFLQEVYYFSQGLRILNQDPFECLISFIISQQKQIPQIQSCIETLCGLAGEALGDGLYGFPSVEKLVPFIVSQAKLGFREKYVNSVVSGTLAGYIDLESKRTSQCSYAEAMSYLTSLYGVGVKVANCVALYSLGHTNAFPIDVHIKRILELPQMEGFNATEYGENAGLLQLYLFRYAINHEGL